MTNEAARAIFTAAHEAAIARNDLEAAAKLEVIREYFTNEAFRANLQQHVWDINQKTGR